MLVYQAHKERVANTVRYEPSRDVQGYCIDQMMTHSKIVIENEDATSLNCATFDDFGTIFGIIEDESGIRYDRVYPALRYTGKMQCYSEFKRNHGNVFSDIKEYTRICKRSGKLSVRRVADAQLPCFTDVRTKKYRVSKQDSERAIKISRMCGVATSHLNLYFALTGLKRLVADTPKYFSDGDEDESVVDALRLLTKANDSLETRRDMLRAWMGL